MGLIRLLMDVVEAPIAIVKDVVTLGGTLSEDSNGSYTVKKLNDIGDDWNEIKENLSKL